MPSPKPPQQTQLEKLGELLGDRFWRLNNLYWIQDAHGKKVKFRLNWAQKHFYQSMWYLNEILKVRQIGMSTLIGIMQLDHALFNRDQACGVIDRTDVEAKKKLKRIRYAYDHLPDVDDPTTSMLGAALHEALRLTAANEHTLEFSNGSRIWAGTTLRGSTVNFLHVSELGYIAADNPKRASEIASGSFNTVHAGNLICVEATHEGGRYGLNYELIRTAQRFNPETATPLDWRFHFFPWWGEPSYRLDPPARGFPVSLENAAYFKDLEEKCSIKLSDAQKWWYIKKAASPKVDMARQYPGTPEEALTALTEGAIYGKQIMELRARGRVTDFDLDDSAPIITSWDLGQSDYHAIWFIQIMRMEFRVYEYQTGQMFTPGQLAATIYEFENRTGRQCLRHFLPHDADSTNSTAKSLKNELHAAGLKNTATVPRTPDVWFGIKHARGLLPSCYFHATHCEREVEIEKRILPSGLGALEGYRSKAQAVGGRVLEMPEHDQASHGSDAFRTFAEAHQRGMIETYLRGVPAAISPYGRLKRFRDGGAKRGIRNPSTMKSNLKTRDTISRL